MRKITLFLMLFCMSIGTALSGNYVPGNRTLTLEAGKKYFISTAMNYNYHWGSSLHLLYTNTSGTLTRSSISPTSTITDDSYLFTVEEVGADYLVYLKNSKDKYVQADNLNSTETKTGLYVIPYHIAKNVCCGADVNALDEKGNIIAYADITAETPVVTVQKNKDYTNRDTKGGWRYLPGENLTAGMNNWSTPFAFYEVIDLDAELNAELNAKKDALNSKIQQAENLLSTAGFSFVPGEKVALQVNNSSGAGYLSSNADHNALGGSTDGGGIAALIDGKSQYFHTSWGGTDPGAPHYIQVDLGDGEEIQEFLFNYTTRDAESGGTSPAPTIIEVYGGNEASNITNHIETFKNSDADNPLPSYTDRYETWTSNKITADQPYRYLRFTVTGSDGPGTEQYNGYYFFCMAEFGLSLPEQVVVTNNSYQGKEQELNNLNEEVEKAKNVVKGSNIVDIEAAIAAIAELISASTPRVNINLSLSPISDSDNLLYGLKGYIGTFSAPYATAIPDGVTAYYASPSEVDGTNSITLTALAATGTSDLGVPAEFGVILVSNTPEVTMSPIDGHIDTPKNAFSHSANGSVEMGANCYVLAKTQDQGIGFYLTEEGTTLKAGKAYIQLSNSSQTSALRLVLDETVTGINGVATEKVDAPIYDLSGRRVLNTVKGGIYIQNGKKFIVK